MPLRFDTGGGGLRIPWPGGVFGEPSATLEGQPVAPGTAVETAIAEFVRRHSTPAAAPPGATVPAASGGPEPAPAGPPIQPAPPPSAEPVPGTIGSGLEPDDFLPGEHALDPWPIFDDMGPPPPLPGGSPNPMIPTPPGASGPPFTPEQPGPPVIFAPGAPSLMYDAPPLPGVTAAVGGIAREILRQVVRRIIRTRPRRLPPIRRRRIEEPPTWPRRPRRYGEPTPAPRRAPRPRIPRQTPDQPEWTSPYPQIETAPQVPLPPPVEVPRTIPDSPQPARMPAPPVPPTPGGSPWPVSPVPTFPAPPSAPAPAPGAPATPATRTSTTPRPRTTSWPLQNPGALIAGAALSLLLRNRSAAPSRFPLRWGSPSPAPTPGVSPSPFPSGVPSPFPLPGVPTVTAPLPSPLTGLNASALPFAQTEAARDRCHCPKPKKGKRRKCRVRVGVVWKSGPRKGQDAGTRCLSFAK